MRNIWFTSDTHFNHKNIVRGTSSWGTLGEGSHQSTRDFDTLEEHNQTLIDNFNQLIKPGDEWYHLGDVAFGGHENIKVFMDAINCKNVHLIFGNHDQHIEPVDSPYRKLFKSCRQRFELSLRVGTETSGKFGKTRIFMSHYAHRVWNQSHHGTIHLYGHSHGTLSGIGKSMDVGVDTNNLYPYHLDEILDIMKTKETAIIDHHNSNTN
jgi:calcineurin-like phosphoesterase family protein